MHSDRAHRGSGVRCALCSIEGLAELTRLHCVSQRAQTREIAHSGHEIPHDGSIMIASADTAARGLLRTVLPLNGVQEAEPEALTGAVFLSDSIVNHAYRLL